MKSNEEEVEPEIAITDDEVQILITTDDFLYMSPKQMKSNDCDQINLLIL